MSFRLKLTGLILFLLLAVSSVTLAQSTVIWYLPHPDDETIGMADAIHQSVLKGNRNYFIYFTKGENSFVREILRGPDGTVYRLTKEEFGQARVKETMAALVVLGVRPDQILFLDYPDGRLPQEAAEGIMRQFAALFPGSLHRTVSIHDSHQDHQTLARALAKVSGEDNLDIRAEYFHVYIYRNTIREEVEKRSVLYPEIKALALAEFKVFAPEEGRYAIAASSTADLIAGALQSEFEYLDSDSPAREESQMPFSLPVGFTLSSLDLGFRWPLTDSLSIDAVYDFQSASALAQADLVLPANLPFIRLSVGAGYHLGFRQIYIGTKASLGPYFLKMRHIPQRETRFGIGLDISPPGY